MKARLEGKQPHGMLSIKRFQVPDLCVVSECPGCGAVYKTCLRDQINYPRVNVPGGVKVGAVV